MYDDCFDDDDCPFTAASHTNYGDECLMDDAQANVVDECFDDDDCPFPLASQANYGDECLMDDSQANVYDECFDDDDDDCLFTLASHTNYGDECLMDDDDDDSPFQDDSPSNVNGVDDPLPSHESHPTRHTQPHSSTLSGRIELSDSQMPPPPPCVPSFEPPMRSGLSPDIISRLTFDELLHNPEFMDLQTTVSNLMDENAEQRRKLHVRALNQARKRILEWRMRVPA